MKKNNYRNGNTLVMLLFFIVILITITASSVVLSIVNTQSIHDLQGSIKALQIAESGAEEALLRLIRNPDYLGGDIDVGAGSAIITVEGEGSKIIESYGQYMNFSHTIQVQTSYTDNVLIVEDWSQIY